MRKIVVDLDSVMKPCKPYADSILQNMKKSELIEYVRILENNCDVAVAALNQQTENVKDWEPVKHGYWELKTHGSYGRWSAFCSNCKKRAGIGGTIEAQKKPYCPNCGAKMKDGA